MEKNNEQRTYILLLIVLCLISFGLGYFIFKHNNPKEISTVPVSEGLTLNATPLKGEDVIVKNSYVGYVEAINQVQIIPYITGYIQNVAIKAGASVKKDDLLLTIDPNEYKARLDAAEAAVLQAEAQFEYNQNYYNRVQKSGKKAFSEIETDNAKNNFLQAQASLKNAQANKALAEVNYHYTIIKAPFSGLIGNFTLSPGDYVSPASGALLSIVQTDPIRIVFSLTDAEYLNMKNDGALFKNSVIKLKLANGQNYEYTGDFKYTDNQLNKPTNSIAVYTYFKNDKNELLPNAFVTVEVLKTFKDSVMVDKNYIKMQQDGSYLTLARNNQLQKVPVQILADKDNQYVLKNTFQTGDLLILDDVSRVKEGTKLSFNIVK
ncbi:MAG: efflux RND transporter periplasmic adaptor subunit [Alphaproteobacteria bacterium]|nr:efflux RND transporter periplasmic adaptor subunit [Alphaproteobacteria bacterium]